MYLERDETESIVKNSAEAFVRQEHSLDRLRLIRPGAPAHDRQMWRKLAQQGWLAMRLPEGLGGSGLTARHAGAIGEVFGRHLVPEPFVSCALVPAVLAARANRPGAWRDVVAALEHGERIVAVAWQEDPQSLEVVPVSTVASPNAAGVRVNGVKCGIVGAAMADLFLVTARLNDRPVLLTVSGSAPGVHLETVTTSDGGSLGMLRMQDAPAEGAALLEGETLSQALEAALDEAMLVLAAQLRGMAEAAFEITLDYMRTRVQFDRVIGSFQSLQHGAVDLKLQHRLAAASYLSALHRLESAAGSTTYSAAVTSSISAAKARASEAAIATGRFGVQVHGAIGFTTEADIGLYLKSALRVAALLGNAALHRQRFSTLTLGCEEQA